MESRADRSFALVLTLLFHAGLIALVWFSARWSWAERDAAAAGSPMQATLMVSAADIRRAQQAVQASTPPAAREASPPPQPLPSPNPQTSDTPLQVQPQEALDQPDTVDQERISRLAQEQAEREAQEQEQRRRQEQIELTESIARQQEAERRQRLREQIEAIQREREIAEKRTRMEEQRLRQLTDLQTAQARTAAAANGNRGADQGARGDSADADLRARYIAALNAAVRANWNTAQATERVYCSVSFTQIPGGEVIHVEFIDCPYDAQGRDSVERALRKNPMPYSGFESVFWRKPTLTLCYPEEVCQR